MLDLGYKVKTKCDIYHHTLSLVGIEIVPLLSVILAEGSSKSLSLSTSLGLKKCSIMPTDIFWVVLFTITN